MRSASSSDERRARRLSKENDGHVGRERRLSKENDGHTAEEGSRQLPKETRTSSPAAKVMIIADELSAAHTTVAPMIATYSCHGMVNRRPKTNQDCASVALLGDASAMICCVYDGHGTDGTAVANQIMHSMNDELGTRCDPKVLRRNPGAALTAAFEAVQTRLARGDLPMDSHGSGACSLVAYICERTLTVANAGDCLCVIGTASPNGATTADSLRQLSLDGAAADGAAAAAASETPPRYQASKLSTEHKVDHPAEKQRIEAAGGWVRPAEYEDGELVTAARLYHRQGEQFRKLGPGMAISRSLGDLEAISCGMSALPEVQAHKLQEHDAFLIMASDGIWEFISPQDAVDLVAPIYYKGGKTTEACEALIQLAVTEWIANDGDYYRDDITALVVYLPALLAELDAGTLLS